jgi:uncharacterized membrane protein
MSIILTYSAVLATLFVLDAVWIGVLAKSFYASTIGHLYRDPIIWWAAILFYVLYAAGIMFFVVLPAESTLTAFLFGALFGFMAYMTYDLVNYSTLAGWPLSVVIVDVLWGMTITAIASVVGMLVG